ncbi:M24 family metallopeptidase [Halobacterium sp. KA-6]|jgi:Xaa-Pro aminopeptidase|uniref:M24 family metallopeptidase n=1 Tax=Halobacterium sp. KA-6 TaxID=2896368 RepID=UPI001E604347|nr:M24 family metallopeptidase [Halobacterium sp. KA-6]MCD2203348.1 M24 family metallopeptidase [Halobacterium sp. KA-6]
MTVTKRLDAYLASTDYEAVWFARPNSFAWLTEGGDNIVDRTGDIGEAAVGYDGDTVTVVTNNIEAPRLRAEELPEDITIQTYQWYERDLAAAVAAASPTPAAADFPVEGFAAVDASPLRQPLTADQIETYRALARDVADAVESVARSLSPETTERSAATTLRTRLESQGIAAPVVLVGGSERAQAYRHYTPKDEPLGGYALVSVTAHRDGLFSSCTRTVAFDDAPAWLTERTRDAMRVEASALAATQEMGRAGGTAGDVFEAIQDAYAALGWDGEWEHHHQGGAAGFAGREWIATPESTESVELPMAYAWNPTVQGAKSEDLFLVTDEEVEPLTVTGDWPMTTVSAVDSSVTLERHAVLER